MATILKMSFTYAANLNRCSSQ